MPTPAGPARQKLSLGCSHSTGGEEFERRPPQRAGLQIEAVKGLGCGKLAAFRRVRWSDASWEGLSDALCVVWGDRHRGLTPWS